MSSRWSLACASIAVAVASFPLSAYAAPADAVQLTTLNDPGLKPWRRYAWRAEVRGADLPGSSLKGAWSRPSISG